MSRPYLHPLACLTFACSLTACDDAVVGPDDDGNGGATGTTQDGATSGTSSAAGTDAATDASSGTSDASTSSGDGGSAGGGGSGGGACVDECDLDEVSCLQDGVITCVVGDDGCTTWSEGEPCPSEEPYCVSGSCSTECDDECEPNDVRCGDDGARHCYATSTPDGLCFRWEPAETCEPANACLAGSCVTDVGCVTTPVTCDAPPASECVDDDTLRVWDTSGLCEDDGSCSYQQNDIDCANCPSCDACEGVTCDDPPSICFEANGTCDGGSCSYAFDDDADCSDGDDCTTGDSCGSGVCAGSAMVCDDPGPPTCFDESTLRTFSSSGTCQAGECEYPFVDETCPDACEAGACVGGWTPTSEAACPEARQRHTAVWTGSRMVVWGGSDMFANNRLNSGGRYDPVTDSWSATAVTGAPSPREHHTAVWTNAEMIVWGGSPGGNEDNGARYEPTTNTWSAMSNTNGPRSYFHTAVWTGSQMLVWGGGGGQGGRYTPATDTWATIATSGEPSARRDHSAVWTGTEMIVWGGQNDGGSARVNTGGRYNPATDTWVNVSTFGAPSARGAHRAVWTGSRMIVWGGVGQAFWDDGGLYDPVSDTWTALPAVGAPEARHTFSAVWTGAEMIVWGGINAAAQQLDTGGAFHPASNQWTALPTAGAPFGREGAPAVWTGNEMIVWGGANFLVPTFTGGRYAP
jgi:N-acetylneuraminic acid mutarotase